MTVIDATRDSSGSVKDLVILGAGGLGAEIVSAIDALNSVTPSWRLVGFLDDDVRKLSSSIAGVPVIGSLDSVADFPQARFIIGVAHYRRPHARLAIAERLALPNERYATLIHPSAAIAPGSRLGHGTVIFAFTMVGDGARLGNHVVVSSHCRVSHDTVVDDGATVAAGALVSGGARVGAGAYVGAGGIIRDGVTLGAGCIVGIGSVVMRDVEPDVTVLGNPARRIPGTRGGSAA